MILLQQPAEATKPGSVADKQRWPDRSLLLKVALPILLMCSVLSSEVVAFRLWQQDALFSWQGLFRLVFAAALPFLALLVPLVFVVLSNVPPFRSKKPPARTLRLDETGIRLSQTKYARVGWRDVRRWFIAPVPGDDHLVTLTLERGHTQKPSRLYWAIVLDKPEQKHAFVSQIDYLRQTGKTEAPVIEVYEPLPQRKLGLKGMWAFILGYYLFIHGAPLLGVSLVPPDPNRSPSRMSPAAEAQMERGLRQVIRHLNIRNETQLRTAFALCGGALTAAALALFFWGNKRQNREATELNRLYDLELEKISCPPFGTARSRESASDT